MNKEIAQKTEHRPELHQALAEIRRELAVRSHIYPRLVLSGRLSEQEATRRMLALTYAEVALARLVEP